MSGILKSSKLDELKEMQTRYIIIKISIVKDKGRILKALRKTIVYIQGSSLKKVLRILYPAILLFRIKGEMINFQTIKSLRSSAPPNQPYKRR